MRTRGTHVDVPAQGAFLHEGKDRKRNPQAACFKSLEERSYVIDEDNCAILKNGNFSHLYEICRHYMTARNRTPMVKAR